MIWAAGNPQIYRVWPPKNLQKITNFHLKKTGAAALGLCPKLLLSGFSTAAALRRCDADVELLVFTASVRVKL